VAKVRQKLSWTDKIILIVGPIILKIEMGFSANQTELTMRAMIKYFDLTIV
jgi:hypothetical protein